MCICVCLKYDAYSSKIDKQNKKVKEVPIPTDIPSANYGKLLACCLDLLSYGPLRLTHTEHVL